MKVLIVGAGASGVAAAINNKRKFPNDDVTIIEHSDKALKKILATGNGRCNLGNKDLDVSLYNNPELLCDYSFNEYVRYIESFGFKTKTIGSLLYPYSESAQTVRNQLLKKLNDLKVNIHLSEKLLDYKLIGSQIVVKTSLNEYKVDKLVIATGGKSTTGLGNDGSIYQILKDHQYDISPLRPGLVPIKTKENTKLLDGIRIKACVSLFENGSKVFTENGEVLFKKDGLSGIVIMNLSNHIKSTKNNYEISLDLLPDFNEELLKNHHQFLDKSLFLEEYVSPKIASFFESHFEPKDYYKKLRDLRFNFKDFYSFENSQITIGGINPKILSKNLESSLEPNVYFIGEIIDIHGPCGGYNLIWAFTSAKRLFE